MFKFFKRNHRPIFNIVTGSDSTHFRSLKNLLHSIARHERALRPIVYDLGMTKEELDDLKNIFDIDIIEFDFKKYPEFYNIRVNAGQYAWKPAIVHEVSQNNSGIICWMDAGNILKSNLNKLIKEVTYRGFYSPRSSGTVKKWTHPQMFDYLGLPRDFEASSPNLTGACVAFDLGNPRARELLEQWHYYASIQECIAPAGSRANLTKTESL